MKISVSFTLLLLLGSVSPSENVESQQPFPQDIYAALRKMTASLVQLKADMMLLQREITDITLHLKAEVNKQKAEIGQQKTEVDKQKTEVDKLKQQLNVRQVAFSASLLAGGKGNKYIGPFRTDTTLIYKHVQTNIGNAYNSNTRVFTAPVRGVYHFEWFITGNNGAHAAGAMLVKNSENVFMAWEKLNYGNASNGVTLLLEVGDIVFVRLSADNVVRDKESKHTTFSGHLLFPM
ncbi:complement C1q-like protein 4 [Perca fluviatilis]|uniref:complement C1q-like protein 4 n=1 Tax=Perca fluviatilis TaxID=8168 RepID=UPI001965EEAC|nr:complement C1q-like protein 4 [Perca fluviatilis]